MGKLTEKKLAILRYLSICTGLASPTEIGEACGKEYYAASSWAHSSLKPMIKDGLVVGKGYYEITPAGRAALSPENGERNHE